MITYYGIKQIRNYIGVVENQGFGHGRKGDTDVRGIDIKKSMKLSENPMLLNLS